MREIIVLSKVDTVVIRGAEFVQLQVRAFFQLTGVVHRRLKLVLLCSYFRSVLSGSRLEDISDPILFANRPCWSEHGSLKESKLERGTKQLDYRICD